MRCLLALGLAVSIAIGASSARAQVAPEPIRLDYAAFAESCPDHETLWQRVLARASAERAAEGQAAATFRVLVSPTDGGVEAVLEVVELDGSASERTLVGRDCDEAVSAVALIVALAIEERARERIDLAEEVVPVPVVEVPAPIIAEPVPAPVPAPWPWPVRLGASFELAAGRTPDALFGLDVFFAVRQEARDGSVVVGPAFRIALAWAHAATITVNGESAQFDWITAHVDACPISLAITRDFFIDPCAAVEAGVLVGAGVSVVDAQTVTQPWAALGGGLRVLWRIASALGVELGGTVLAPVIRDRFAFASGATVLQVPEVGALFDLGLSATIW